MGELPEKTEVQQPGEAAPPVQMPPAEEVLFEVKSALTEQQLFEAYKVYYFRQHRAWSVIGMVLGAFCVLFALNRAITLLAVEGAPFSALLSSQGVLIAAYLVIGILFIVTPLLRAKITARRVYAGEAVSKLLGERIRLITEEGIYAYSVQASSVVYWSQFGDCYLTKNTLVMYFGLQFILVDLNGLTKGNRDDFVAFMRRKVTVK